ncbi:MAG: PAS domain-containing protein [Proteobacteria bacterium]|nr:PAS domain-containing protein [Pseudomonadota bacterium]
MVFHDGNRVPWQIVAVMALPSVAVLLALGFADPRILAAAAGLWLIAIAVLARLAIGHYRRLVGLARLAEEVARIAGPLPPADDAGLTRRTAQILARLEERLGARIAALEALAQARQRIFDSVPDPLLLLGPGRVVVDANAAARELFGPRVIERNLVEVLRQPAVLAAAEATLAEGIGRMVEITLPAPVDLNFSIRISPLPGTGGGQLLVLLHDVTGLKRLERMRADFVANASHELRTPLTTLIGFVETLRGPAKDDVAARERFLEIMHEQSQRMARLVGDLLSLSRIEVREHTPPTDIIVLGELLPAVKATLDIQAAKRGMTIGLEFAGALPPIAGDADELTQVFQNLIDNALKYGKVGAELRIVAEPAKEPPPSYPPGGPAAVSIAVIDQGEGIPREHLARLTERFYRVDAARSRAMGGTGLGLAIVKHIVNHHRGALTIDSTIGRGSTFTVFLPVATQAMAAAQHPMLRTGSGAA